MIRADEGGVCVPVDSRMSEVGVAVDGRRAAGGWLALAALAVLIVLAVAGPLQSPRVPVPDAGRVAAAGDQVSGPSGEVLYTASCAACHGVGGAGTANG